MKIILAICFVLTLVCQTSAFANDLMPSNYCLANGVTMSQYKASFAIPNPLDVNAGNLVLRFYQPWGNGQENGWQIPVTLPTVTLNGKSLKINTLFSYTHNYNAGPVRLGYDQYAQYYVAQLPATPANSELEITGTFQQVAYFSAALYVRLSNNEVQLQQEIIDNNMPLAAGNCNPYIEANPSVFAYPNNVVSVVSHATVPNKLFNKFNERRLLPTLPKTSVDMRTGKINVYRLDQQDSQQDFADDIAPDGCSRDYLFARKNWHQEVMILRIKVADVFMDDNHPDKLFHSYQARYLSIGAHRKSEKFSPMLYFWTVNTQMLKKFQDAEGYAYVFFAPNAMTRQLAAQQHTDPTQPPIIQWGRYQGYVLGNPNYAIIIGYRVADSTWQGSPENATCYATAAEMQPVTVEELGEYTPEIFGGSLQDFNHGNIGSVDKNAPWPDLKVGR